MLECLQQMASHFTERGLQNGAGGWRLGVELAHTASGVATYNFTHVLDAGMVTYHAPNVTHVPHVICVPHVTRVPHLTRP